MSKKISTSRRVLAVMVFAALSNAYAAEQTGTDNGQTLQTVQVQGKKVSKELGKEKVRRKKLDEQLVQDIHDMVRYDPGVSVVEGGRAGSNGFAMRGVDKDRVAITVDGLAQAESRSSTAFQELFGSYGNFNTNRNAIELENISEVNVIKGADSISAGSGALGGAVMYSTKSPKDYLKGDKNWYAGLKGGYISKNRQWMGSTTLAGRWQNFDGIFVYTKRNSHELKNYGDAKDATVTDRIGNNSYTGVARAQPDPQSAQRKSTLLKFGYHFTPNNYLSYVYDDDREDRQTHELSNLFSTYDQGSRYRNDVSYRKRWGLEYENLLDAAWAPWDKLTANFDRQKIDMTTMTWDLPNNYASSGINSQAFYRWRVLSYKMTQARLAAEKHIDFGENHSWDLQYGINHSKSDADNSNLEYFAYVAYPTIRTSNTDVNEFLVSGTTKTSSAYLSNVLRFGDLAKLKFGARYDRVKMTTKDDAGLSSTVKTALENAGLWNQAAKFSAPSYAAGFDFNVGKNVTLQAKYGTAFRAPTTDEMWFAYPSQLFYVDPNPNLKDERSKNLEFGVDVHGGWGNFKLSAFRTRYSDFIDFVAYENANRRIGTADIPVLVYKNVNRSKATVKGIELQSHWNLDSIGLPKGSYTTLAASYQKGSASPLANQSIERETPINAIQPFNAVWGVGYNQPDNRWSVGVNVSYFAKKKGKDTVADFSNTYREFPYVHHSKAYTLVDLIGHYQIGKNLTLRGGIFNLLDKKYYAWNTLRSIREFGTVNRVDNCNGSPAAPCANAGIERLTAPGRNYSLVLEAKF